MKLILLPLMGVSLFCTSVKSQDTIYVNSGYARQTVIDYHPEKPKPPGILKVPLPYSDDENVVTGKVTKITGSIVFFRAWGIKKPQRWLYIKDIDSVKYANGKHENFAWYYKKITDVKKQKEKYTHLADNNIVSGIGFFGYKIPFFDKTGLDYTPVLHLYAGYERMLLNAKLGLSVTPFVGLNRKAVGISFSPKFYPLQDKKVRIGMGPALMLSHQNYAEAQSSSYAESFGKYIKKEYETTLSILSFDYNMQGYITKKLFFNYEICIGGVVGNSRRKNYIPQEWGSFNKGQYLMRMGLGYRF